MNRDTGEGPGENRGPLLLCFLCLHHPVEAGFCPARRLFCHVSGRAPVGAGVPDGPHRFSFMLPAGIFRAPARHPFAHGGKRMQKRRQRPMVFGIPFVRLQSRRKKSPTTNRLYFYPRCRSRVLQCSAVSYRRRTMLWPLLYTAMYHDLKFSAAQRAAHTLAGGGKCAI